MHVNDDVTLLVLHAVAHMRFTRGTNERTAPKDDFFGLPIEFSVRLN